MAGRAHAGMSNNINTILFIDLSFLIKGKLLIFHFWKLVISESIHAIPHVASWNSEGKGRVSRTGILRAWGIMQFGITNAWGVSALNFQRRKTAVVNLPKTTGFSVLASLVSTLNKIRSSWLPRNSTCQSPGEFLSG